MRRGIVSLCLSFTLIILGSILCAYEFINYDIAETFNNADISKKTTIYDIELNGNNNLIDTTYTKNNTIKYDNTLGKGKIRLEITHYNAVIDVNKYIYKDDNENIIFVRINYNEDFEAFKKMFRVTIDGLKEHHFYNYEEALKPELKIFINEADKDIVKIR